MNEMDTQGLNLKYFEGSNNKFVIKRNNPTIKVFQKFKIQSYQILDETNISGLL